MIPLKAEEVFAAPWSFDSLGLVGAEAQPTITTTAIRSDNAIHTVFFILSDPSKNTVFSHYAIYRRILPGKKARLAIEQVKFVSRERSVIGDGE
jgi:hypothetical protein